MLFELGASGSSAESSVVPPVVTAVPVVSVAVSVVGPDGRVTSAPAGIDCPGVCAASFAGDVTLTATPTSTSATFEGWGGTPCEGMSGATCTIRAVDSSSASVDAIFRAAAILDVRVSGSGRVTASPAGIDPSTGRALSLSCTSLTAIAIAPTVNDPGAACEVGYAPRERVTLSANGISGFPLTAWGRYGCATSQPCTIEMSSPGDTVDATFDGRLLGVVIEGSGSVRSNPTGIDCRARCVGGFTNGSTVTLTAVPGSDALVNWTQKGCFVPVGQTPALTCVLTLTSDVIVVAGFGFFSFGIPALNERAFVTVQVGGAGSGHIIETDSKGRATSCENPTCSREFNVPDLVTVRAEPSSPSSRFDRWLSGCPPAAQSCQINTRFLTSFAVCFKPASPPHAMTALTLRKRNGNWRIILRITPPSHATVIRFRLTRHTRTAFAFPAIHATGTEQTVSLKIPPPLPSGRYGLQATVSDSLQCTTKLSPRTVKLSRRR